MPVRWNIVERPAMAKLGRAHFQTDELRFHDTIGAVDLTRSALLFTGSLQYLATPFDVLGDAIQPVDVVALDRVLVSPTAAHAVFVQHPHPIVGYSKTYPVWCFAKDRLIDWFAPRGLRLVDDFTAAPQSHFDRCGMLFMRDGAYSAPGTSHGGKE
jgi:putative methyltransferase (TIGR04325 family)